MEELCAARTQDEVIRIGASFAKKACNVDSVSVVLTSGEYFHDAPGGRPEKNTQAVRTRVVIRMSVWALEAGQTVVVPDVQRDERTRSHTNGSGGVRSLVVVPVGGRTPFAAITCAWAQERWPAPADVLILEALARSTGLALTSRSSQSLEDEADETNAIAAWLGEAADAEGLRELERQRRLVSADFQHRTSERVGDVKPTW